MRRHVQPYDVLSADHKKGVGRLGKHCHIADFGAPYQWLKERDLITMETDADEWRFQWIVDPRDARKLFQIEHEVRSMKHRLFNRPLVNRNHGITNMTYVPGHDAFRGTY